MLSRSVVGLVGALLFGFVVARAGDDTQSWYAVEIMTFTDFDDVQVKLDGKETKAFLVGLRPLRETVKEKEQLERLRTEVTAKLRKNSLSARILTEDNAKVVGLSVDAFMHHKNDFGHAWDPAKYTYCWSGWGAYNLNTFWMRRKAAIGGEQAAIEDWQIKRDGPLPHHLACGSALGDSLLGSKLAPDL
jgi:hypothetical protein